MSEGHDISKDLYDHWVAQQHLEDHVAPVEKKPSSGPPPELGSTNGQAPAGADENRSVDEGDGHAC
ncbi:hypothetical protein EWM64_g9636 [Hericium alpestre]|uniref:Uncharacterized protein n=1 Tax=Hericium alpestre TaxID=135208 RepID=A0A4Y9ZI12_9AGAM|nr:hypothetical protein EWM64_g9636 [Hericium alpestre]